MYIKIIYCLIILYINFILCHNNLNSKKNHIYSSNLYDDYDRITFSTPTTKYLPTDFYI